MKVLIISHNTFSDTSNVGKTLKTWFDDSDFTLYNFYIRPLPNDNIKKFEEVCCFTDLDAIDTLFKKRSSVSYLDYCSQYEAMNQSKFISGEISEKKVFSKSRGKAKYFFRDVLWHFSKASKILDEWVETIKPDIIFFTPGYATFLYDLVFNIHEKYGIPIYSYIFDDYFNSSNNIFSCIFYQKRLNEKILKLFEVSSKVGFISESMFQKYLRLTNHSNLEVIMTPFTHKLSPREKKVKKDKTIKMYFIGNVSVGRIDTLNILARAVSEINKRDYLIDFRVFSFSLTSREKEKLIIDNYNYYFGTLSPSEVIEMQESADVLVHVESFEEKFKKEVEHSFSTKIANYLSSNALILAIGSSSTFSINYLFENSAAEVITNNSEVVIYNHLRSIIDEQNREKYITYISNATRLAQLNHSKEKNIAKLHKSMERIVYD